MIVQGFRRDGQGPWIAKDPVAIKDYSIDWADFLGSDSIAQSSWEAGSGMTAQTPSTEGTMATVWLAGGEEDAVYRIASTIVTNAGRTDRRSFRVVVRKQ